MLPTICLLLSYLPEKEYFFHVLDVVSNFALGIIAHNKEFESVYAFLSYVATVTLFGGFLSIVVLFIAFNTFTKPGFAVVGITLV